MSAEVEAASNYKYPIGSYVFIQKMKWRRRRRWRWRYGDVVGDGNGIGNGIGKAKAKGKGIQRFPKLSQLPIPIPIVPIILGQRV